MRKRKRADYTLRVVRYRAYPHTIPQSVWDIAKAQRALWNQLVALANQHSEWARLLGDKKLGWRDFDATTHGLVRASPLDWCNGPDILERLSTAMRSKRWPRLHGALGRISLSHRFTNGGIGLNKVVDHRRAQRFSLQASDDWQLPRKAHSPTPNALEGPLPSRRRDYRVCIRTPSAIAGECDSETRCVARQTVRR
jgi:hypothetical protein